MRKRYKKENKFNKILEMPKEIYSNEPKITVTGFNELLIENYKAVLEYEEFYVRVSTYIGIININGFNLVLNEMSKDDLLITGKIDGIDFEIIVDEEEEE